MKETFEELHDVRKVAEAQTDLAYCYWRQGSFDEGRLILRQALARLPEDETYQRAVVYLRSALLENSAIRFSKSLQLLREAMPLFEGVESHSFQGKFHNTLALVLRNLGTIEQRDDYIDQALIEYTAASFHFEQAGHTRYQACVENNLAFLFLSLGRLAEAHEHLDRARPLLLELRDQAHVAQVDDTRARVHLAEGRNVEAERVAESAVEALEKGGELSLLVEALTTLGISRARTGQYDSSRRTLRRASEIGEQAGDPESAGIAALSTLEELSEQLNASEMVALYEQAIELLRESQHRGIPKRMLSCRDNVLSKVETLLILGRADAGTDMSGWDAFGFRKEIRRYERVFLERALKDADGSPTRAAQLLGFKNHQSLISLINSQHESLIEARSTVRPRNSNSLLAINLRKSG